MPLPVSMARSQASATSLTPSRSRSSGDRLLVPGQLAVVVAGRTHHAVVLSVGEMLDRVGELGVGIQDPGHVRRRGEHLEPVAGDDQHPGQRKLFSTWASSSAARVDTSVAVGARCRSLTTTTRLPRRHLEPDQIGDERTLGRGRAAVRRAIRVLPAGRAAPRCAPGCPAPQSCHASGRMIGKRMTSRIAGTSANSMTSRSMPMPMPDVGGSPYSSARTKARRPGGPRRRLRRPPRPRP